MLFSYCEPCCSEHGCTAIWISASNYFRNMSGGKIPRSYGNSVSLFWRNHHTAFHRGARWIFNYTIVIINVCGLFSLCQVLSLGALPIILLSILIWDRFFYYLLFTDEENCPDRYFSTLQSLHLSSGRPDAIARLLPSHCTLLLPGATAPGLSREEKCAPAADHDLPCT